MSLLAIRWLHAEALCCLYPDVKIAIHGHAWAAARKICASLAKQNIFPAETRNDFYYEPARPDCLVSGVGAYRPGMLEIGSRTIRGSLIYVDDPVGVPTKAGDIIQAGVSWDFVHALAKA
ncbi:MAG: hypothetical protein ABF932_12900 [Gluconobacter potus]|uniref:hypothetical protein n=1 Tax=Gluconobacter TaxID=441 RepID=UPI001D177388|nr:MULTISPECIES: hypothetical protein [Gluconobacter]